MSVTPQDELGFVDCRPSIHPPVLPSVWPSCRPKEGGEERSNHMEIIP